MLSKSKRTVKTSYSYEIYMYTKAGRQDTSKWGSWIKYTEEKCRSRRSAKAKRPSDVSYEKPSCPSVLWFFMSFLVLTTGSVDIKFVLIKNASIYLPNRYDEE